MYAISSNNVKFLNLPIPYLYAGHNGRGSNIGGSNTGHISAYWVLLIAGVTSIMEIIGPEINTLGHVRYYQLVRQCGDASHIASQCSQIPDIISLFATKPKS